MDKGPGAHLIGLGGDGHAAADPVGVDSQIHIVVEKLGIVVAGDDGGDVGALLLDGLEGGDNALHTVVEEDVLHLGVIGQAGDHGDAALHVGGKVLGQGLVHHDVGVLLHHLLGAAELVLRDGQGGGHDADLVGVLSGGAGGRIGSRGALGIAPGGAASGGHGYDHQHGQQQGNEFLHGVYSS